MGGKIAAGVVIVAFFAALPTWWLSTLDGWVRLHCAGQPWRCEVTRDNLLSRRSSVFEVQRGVSVGTEVVSYKGRKSDQYVLELDGNAVLDSRPSYREVHGLADELNAARAAGRPFDRELEPDSIFWLAIALVVVFAGSGLVIAIGGARSEKPRP